MMDIGLAGLFEPEVLTTIDDYNMVAKMGFEDMFDTVVKQYEQENFHETITRQEIRPSMLMRRTKFSESHKDVDDRMGFGGGRG